MTMAQTQNQTPSPTGLIIETTPTMPGLEALVKKAFGNTGQQARDLGEDTVHDVRLEGMYTVDGIAAPVNVAATIEVGASYTRAQTMAFKTSDAMRDALALLGMFRPDMERALIASMEASRDGGDSAAALEAHGFTISEEARERANAAMARLARESTRTVSAPVKVALD